MLVLPVKAEGILEYSEKRFWNILEEIFAVVMSSAVFH